MIYSNPPSNQKKKSGENKEHEKWKKRFALANVVDCDLFQVQGQKSEKQNQYIERTKSERNITWAKCDRRLLL